MHRVKKQKNDNTKYTVYGMQIQDTELGDYYSYGILFSDSDYIPDISTDRSRVESIAEILNRCDVSQQLFHDVVLDMICE